jgi:nitrogen fixation protein FixH
MLTFLLWFFGIGISVSMLLLMFAPFILSGNISQKEDTEELEDIMRNFENSTL